MKQPGQDVFLNDGCGYLVESGPYKQHLQDSTEGIQVCPPLLSWLIFLVIYFLPSNLPVPIIKLLIRPMQTEKTWRQQV